MAVSALPLRCDRYGFVVDCVGEQPIACEILGRAGSHGQASLQVQVREDQAAICLADNSKGWTSDDSEVRQLGGGTLTERPLVDNATNKQVCGSVTTGANHYRSMQELHPPARPAAPGEDGKRTVMAFKKANRGKAPLAEQLATVSEVTQTEFVGLCRCILPVGHFFCGQISARGRGCARANFGICRRRGFRARGGDVDTKVIMAPYALHRFLSRVRSRSMPSSSLPRVGAASWDPPHGVWARAPPDVRFANEMSTMAPLCDDILIADLQGSRRCDESEAFYLSSPARLVNTSECWGIRAGVRCPASCLRGGWGQITPVLPTMCAHRSMSEPLQPFWHAPAGSCKPPHGTASFAVCVCVCMRRIHIS